MIDLIDEPVYINPYLLINYKERGSLKKMSLETRNARIKQLQKIIDDNFSFHYKQTSNEKSRDLYFSNDVIIFED